ncbi:hypothetical protein [Klebsiella phage KP185]|nr:hypothetical protein [Klebsiella phage KP185]
MGARSSEFQLLSTVLSVVAPESPQGVRLNSYLLHTVSLKVPGPIYRG